MLGYQYCLFMRRSVNVLHINCYAIAGCSTNTNPSDGKFRVLDLKKKTFKPQEKKKYIKTITMAPREQRMPVDQDWTNVWPGPKTFHPASVPLALRQGYDQKRASPGKYGNAELMKIPNFLHLTPPAIKKHCHVLKQFCTKWPNGLETDEDCNKHFPLTVISTDYCHASPTIRDPKARIVTLKFKLSSLQLDQHAKDKMIRLVGKRYDEETDMVTIVIDRCPMRKQNYDYGIYILTALYHESNTFEDWEKLKQEADMEYYVWENNPSKTAYVSYVQYPKVVTEEDVKLYSIDNDPVGQIYKEAVSYLLNNGEDIYTLKKYRDAAYAILLPEVDQTSA
ncbi:28S ribosomal protein S35, mitochondrial [Daktulosphaira vitifoliae]|uniref:28S ribosomal protein S35, mitochondrial n=1 Tax=Daktulosphaira vitifoliae TaxID=58002 RepID=UPI0021AA7514|nr:28S ribosomal protein S35, mitochondrial [Daktulosphaira vitifoliae]